MSDVRAYASHRTISRPFIFVQKKEAGGRGDHLLLRPTNGVRYQSDHVQTIKPFAEEEHVFAVNVCVAAAVQPAGGPTIAVAVTVTFCEGVKPCAAPLPEKYTPALSAAKLSS